MDAMCLKPANSMVAGVALLTTNQCNASGYDQAAFCHSHYPLNVGRGGWGHHYDRCELSTNLFSAVQSRMLFTCEAPHVILLE